MLTRSTRAVLHAPKVVIGAAVAVLIVCGIFGASAAQHLLAGGYSDPNSESAQVDKVLEDTFGRGGLQVVIKLDGPAGTDTSTDPTATSVGRGILDELRTIDYVQSPVLSIWTNPGLSSTLLSRDKTSTLIVFGLDGGEDKAPGYAQEIEQRFTSEREAITVRVGGQALVYAQINEQSSKDLAIAEGIAIPITFLVLVLVFGGLVAASLPVIIGVVSIVITFAFLRLLAEFADVSIFALNLTTAMGLALAIDYTLLLITRYREEVAAGRDRSDAIVVTMATAGRTVAFSAVTVALALAALAIFPMYFLRSFAYAGIGVVAVAALAALILTPAILAVLGPRIDSLNIRRWWRRRSASTPAEATAMDATVMPVEQSVWYRMARFVLRRPVIIGVSVVALLLVLGAPFFSIKFGFPDDRVLPAQSSSHVLQQEIRTEFEGNLSSTVTAVVSNVSSDDAGLTALRDYSIGLSTVADVDAVTSPAGTLVDGAQRAPGQGAASPDLADGVAIVTISTDVAPMTDQGADQLDTLRQVPVPAGTSVGFTGLAAVNADAVESIYAHIPWVFGVIGVATFILLFLFTGSVVLPLKALVLNVLSLSATFGAMVWFFQEGHLSALGTTPTGYLAVAMPILMFCVAFGLSMDYEVFLLGRIREEWLASDQTRDANDHAVAVGLAKTGRVITAAAALMAIVFAAMAMSGVSFMRMFGVGLALAVLMDATLIRMLLVPSFMRLAGRANWWAPGPLRRLHDRFGLSEGGGEPGVDSSDEVSARVG